MALHPETMIRRRVAELLVNAATVAASNVFPSRKIHFRLDELPAIAIYMFETDSEIWDESPRSHKRTATVVVELRLQSAANIDDVDEEMDAFRLEVENVLDYNRYLLSPECATNITPTGTSQDYDASGDRVVAVAAMSYAVEYRSNTPKAESAVPLEKVQTDYNLDNDVDPGNVVTDCVELDGDQDP